MGRISVCLLLCTVLVSCVNSKQSISDPPMIYHRNNESIIAFQDSIIKRHPKWNIVFKKKIYRHKVSVGMTKNMVIASLGLPIYIDSDKTSGQTKERYSYSGKFFTSRFEFERISQSSPYELEPNEYVYLKNGKVTDILVVR